jgi:multidrug efflux system membrane fusion protein
MVIQTGQSKDLPHPKLPGTHQMAAGKVQAAQPFSWSAAPMDSRETSLRPDPYPGGTPVSGKKRRPWLGIMLVVLFVLVIVVLVVRRPKPKPDANAAAQAETVTIHAATVQQGDIGIHVNALGTVTPLSTVSIYSQVTGKVVAVNYREGQMVRKGQSLIEIDPRPYEAQLKQAQGTLQHDQGLLKQAQIDLARYQKAVALNAIAHQTLDDQEQAVEQYKGTVKNDEGQVEYQQVQLSYCHLTAPASGRVGLRLVDPGNTIFAGSSNALVVVTQLQPITVVFNVAEDNLSQVRSQILGRSPLPVDALDRTQLNTLASGHLLTIDNQVDTTTGTIRFRAEFDNRNLALYPNQFVNARLLVNTLHNVLLIPSAAVQRNGVQAFVYKVNSNHTTAIQNIVEKTTDGTISAVEGLNPGDTVATTGFDKLEDGTKVEIEASPQTPVASNGDAAGTLAGKSAPGQTR